MTKRQSHKNWLSETISPDILESKLFRFRVHTEVTLANGEKQSFEVDLTNDADVDYNKLEQQLENVPEQIVFWGSIHAQLRAYAATVERRCKARRAVLIEEATDMIRAGTAPKLTVEQIKMVVEKDELLNRYEELYIKVSCHASKCYNMVNALQIKAENLRSLYSFYRQEYINNHRIGST